MYTPTPADFDVLVAHARAVGIDPRDAALVLFEESGFDPSRAGPAGANVWGLNQTSTANLASLGLTPEAWRAMRAAEQIPHVFDFWTALAKRFNGGRFPRSAGELLALNFLPGAFAAVGAGENPNAVIAGKAGPYAWAYADNPALGNATGTITVNTLETYLDHVADQGGSRWAMLTSGIVDAVARAGEPAPVMAATPPPPSASRGAGTLAALVIGGVATAVAYWMLRKG